MAQPNVGAVTNVASFALPGLPNSGIAQGSMFIIWGSGLSNGNGRQSAFPLSTNLAGTTASVTVGGRTVNALPTLSLSDRVYAVLPSDTPVGTGTITVTYNGQTSAPAPISVVRSSFGIFTSNSAGSGPAAMHMYVSPSESPVNGLNMSARPGQTITMYGAGLGAASWPDAEQPRPGDLPVDVQVFVGGKPAQITYKGRMP